MPRITFIEHNGAEHIVDVASGLSVMEGAKSNAVPGIDADCSGNCACATCHVYVDNAWIDKVGPAGMIEQPVLDFAFDPRKNSRLSCRITVTDELDGLILNLPEKQGI